MLRISLQVKENFLHRFLKKMFSVVIWFFSCLFLDHIHFQKAFLVASDRDKQMNKSINCCVGFKLIHVFNHPFTILTLECDESKMMWKIISVIIHFIFSRIDCQYIKWWWKTRTHIQGWVWFHFVRSVLFASHTENNIFIPWLRTSRFSSHDAFINRMISTIRACIIIQMNLRLMPITNLVFYPRGSRFSKLGIGRKILKTYS